MQRRLLAILSLSLLTSAVSLAADTPAAKPPTLSPYKIGFTVPLTGPLAANAAEYIPGAEIASPISTGPAAFMVTRCSSSWKTRRLHRKAASRRCASSSTSTVSRPSSRSSRAS
jgi:hypothetical protein